MCGTAWNSLIDDAVDQWQMASMKIFYSPNKHGRRINNTNMINNTITERTKTLEARFKFRHTFGP